MAGTDVMHMVVNIFLTIAVLYALGGLTFLGTLIYRAHKEEKTRVLISNLKGEPQPPKVEYMDSTLMILSLLVGVGALLIAIFHGPN